MSPIDQAQPELGQGAVCPRATVATRTAALAGQDAPCAGTLLASSLAPGVAGPALVPPLVTAPAADALDPFGELAAVVIEPEAALAEDNAVLELAVLWQDQLLEVRHLIAPADVTVGESARASLALSSDELPGACFPLVRHSDGAYALCCPPGLAGTLQQGGAVVPLGAVAGWPDPEHPACMQVPLPVDALATVELGGVTLQLRHVPRPGAVPRALLGQVNYGWLNLLLVSVFAHVGFLATAALYPYDTTALQESLFTQPNRFTQFVLTPPAPDRSALLSRLLREVPGASSARADDKEGLAGRRGAEETGQRRASRAERPTGEQVVQRAVGQLFGAGGGLGVGSVLGAELGGELVSALGAVHGARVGDSRGLEGLGTRGAGPGGGGFSTTTFGVGDIHTRGHGDGRTGYGLSSGGLQPRRQRDIEVSQGVQVLSGSLDRELIRQVIADNIAQIRYCYTRELAVSPGLHGKVLVRFVIAGTGQVQSASVVESSLDSAAVEACISSKVQRWLFPRPRGGGIVVVNYPFLFKQSG